MANGSMDMSSAQEFLRRRIHPEGSYPGLLEFPRYFEIETVNACNARCPMCTIDSWTRDSLVMKDALFEKIAEEIGQHAEQVQRVALYRDGEPLLDKKLAHRIARLKELGVRRVGISTNVSLLNEARGRAILEAGIDEVILSIDSLKKEVFESIRVRLVFEEVFENALHFIRLRDEIRPSAQIWVRMIRQASNAGEWLTFEAFWRPRLKPNDRCNFHSIHNWGGQLGNFVATDKTFQHSLPCVALWSLMVIFADGDVPMCNVDYDNRFPNGNVVTSSIRELWQSSVAAERRRLHLEGRRDRLAICPDCNVWDEPSDVPQLSKTFVEGGLRLADAEV